MIPFITRRLQWVMQLSIVINVLLLHTLLLGMLGMLHLVLSEPSTLLLEPILQALKLSLKGSVQTPHLDSSIIP
jgi:hypothetical protein